MSPKIDTNRPEFKRRANDVLDTLEKSLEDKDNYAIKYLLHQECGGSQNTLCKYIKSTQRYVGLLNKEALLRNVSSMSLFKKERIQAMNALGADGKIIKISYEQYRRENGQNRD